MQCSFPQQLISNEQLKKRPQGSLLSLLDCVEWLVSATTATLIICFPGICVCWTNFPIPLIQPGSSLLVNADAVNNATTRISNR